MTGKCIVIEGVEGAGKSTAIATILELLKHHQIPAITTREPGGTRIGEMLRAILKDPAFKDSLDARTELLLIYAARIQLLEEVVRPALQKGIWVVADRFELSTFAYQGGGRGLDAEMINNLSAFSLQGFQPDLTVFMDINPEIGMKRVALRGEPDRFEKESMDFFLKVYAAYHAYLKSMEKVVILDASAPLEQIQNSLKMHLHAFIESHEST